MALLRLEEVATRLGISYTQARIMVYDGKLVSRKVGTRGIRVEEEELKRYIASLPSVAEKGEKDGSKDKQATGGN